jgi:RimJ/RimL family protein N-acetyltransferase
MQLQTERLILRSFREEDVDAMAQLFANPNFMRFSLGAFTERKKTVDFIEKVMGWDIAGMPSQFAVVSRGEHAVIGYCGFHHHPEVPGEIEIGYRLHPDYWNKGLITEAAPAVRDHAFCRFKTASRDFADSPRKYPVTSRGGEKWNEGRKRNYVSRLSDAGVCDNSRTVACEP